MFPEMHTVVPQGVCGAVRVEHFDVDARMAEFSAIRSIVQGDSSVVVRPGRYAKLIIHGSTVMSDTQMERRSNVEVVRMAQGDVLIAGLGLGMILWPIVTNPEVRSVLVVELRPEVIALVGPHIPREKVTVVQGDIKTWRPERGRKFHTIYFDIWDGLRQDNLQQMAQLHRTFSRFKAPNGWMDSWGRGMIKDRARRHSIP